MDLRFGEFMKDLRKENGQRVDNRRGSRMTVRRRSHKPKMKTIVSILALLTTPLVATAELYYNQEFKFSLDAPTGWTVKKSAQPNTVIKFVYRDANARIAVLSIAAYPDTPGALTADGMFATFKDEYRDFTYRRLDSGSTKIRSMEAVWNLIEITDPPQARIIGKHYHFVRNGKIWRVSAMTDSGKDFFATVLPIMDKAILTIAFGL